MGVFRVVLGVLLRAICFFAFFHEGMMRVAQAGYVGEVDRRLHRKHVPVGPGLTDI